MMRMCLQVMKTMLVSVSEHQGLRVLVTLLVCLIVFTDLCTYRIYTVNHKNVTFYF